jgi:hypothetical protein
MIDNKQLTLGQWQNRTGAIPHLQRHRDGEGRSRREVDRGLLRIPEACVLRGKNAIAGECRLCRHARSDWVQKLQHLELQLRVSVQLPLQQKPTSTPERMHHQRDLKR